MCRADVARQHAAEEIVTGAGFVADNDVKRLAAIEFDDALVDLRVCDCRRKAQDRAENSEPAHDRCKPSGAGVERRGNVPRNASWCDQHGVETDVLVWPGRDTWQARPRPLRQCAPAAARSPTTPRRRAARAPSLRQTPGACAGARRCRSRPRATSSAAPGCGNPSRSGMRRRGFRPRCRCGTRPAAPDPPCARADGAQARNAGRRGRGGRPSSLIATARFRKRERALIDLAARTPGHGGDLADRFLDGKPAERLAQQRVDVDLRRMSPPSAAQ